MIPNTVIQQSAENQVPHGRSPAITTTCHLVDDCPICNTYADHFDITSLLAHLDHTDPYTQGLQQGIALQAHETDSLISRYRSRLASSHLKLQTLQSESTARQIEVQTLQTQATRRAMEIELLKRELAIERDRVVALETACDELQVELADERRKTTNGSDENSTLNEQWQDAEEQDWIWDWDDDWETYEKENAEERTGPSTTSMIIDTTTPVGETRKDRDQSPSDEDWGWVYDVSLSDQNAGFYWEDFQESPTAEAGHMGQDPSSSNLELKGLAKVGVSSNNNLKVSDSEDSPKPALSSPSRLPLPYHPGSPSARGSPGTIMPSPTHELTLKQITDLIAVASSINVTPETSISSTHTPQSALIRIRALIQQAEQTPRKQRSNEQVWLLANWRRPTPGSKPQAHPEGSQILVILLKAPTHPTLDLPDVPEIYVDASATGVGFYFPFSSGSNPSQWLAYRWPEGGHPSILLGATGKIVITWAELIAVEMGVHILRALGYGLDDESRTAGTSARAVGDDLSTGQKGKSRAPGPRYGESSPIGTDGVHEHPLRRSRILIRSDNLGVVSALSSLASPKPKVSTVRSERPWPSKQALYDTAERILRTCELYNMQLMIRWVPSKQNLADGPSRASWGGQWNTRLGKGASTGHMGKGEEGTQNEQMLDWDVLRAKTSMERVPEHLKGCLKPVGGGLPFR